MEYGRYIHSLLLQLAANQPFLGPLVGYINPTNTGDIRQTNSTVTGIMGVTAANYESLHTQQLEVKYLCLVQHSESGWAYGYTIFYSTWSIIDWGLNI